MTSAKLKHCRIVREEGTDQKSHPNSERYTVAFRTWVAPEPNQGWELGYLDCSVLPLFIYCLFYDVITWDYE
jgi:hypothetical protein